LISGLLAKVYETRHSPAGIPITRFILEHQSAKTEAGYDRKIYCKVLIVIAGSALHQVLGRLTVGQEISVEGYLNQVSYQGQNPKLCVNAEVIQPI